MVRHIKCDSVVRVMIYLCMVEVLSDRSEEEEGDTDYHQEGHTTHRHQAEDMGAVRTKGS